LAEVTVAAPTDWCSADDTLSQHRYRARRLRRSA
jgi:hypothetical protein